MREAAVAQKYAKKIKKKATDPDKGEKGWWRMEDLKAAFKRYTDNPDDPEAAFFMAKALQMAGQMDQAEDRYDIFAERCRTRFGSHAAAVDHYSDLIATLEQAGNAGGDTGRADPKAISLEDYKGMRRNLELAEERKRKRAKRGCVLS